MLETALNEEMTEHLGHDDLRRRLPGVDVIGAWVELVEPRLDEVMSKMARPAVVVPLAPVDR